MNTLSADHLITLEMATATTIRVGGAPASALGDLLDNGSRAAPESVREVLTFVQQTARPTCTPAARGR